MTASFYDALAPYYHLIYPDWEASAKRQSEAIVKVLGTLDADISLAFRECRRCLRSGGAFIASVRDYAAMRLPLRKCSS